MESCQNRGLEGAIRPFFPFFGGGCRGGVSRVPERWLMVGMLKSKTLVKLWSNLRTTFDEGTGRLGESMDLGQRGRCNHLNFNDSWRKPIIFQTSENGGLKRGIWGQMLKSRYPQTTGEVTIWLAGSCI